jgi:predicted dehydrogenase
VRVGMIGLDTSHSLAFTRVMNASEDEPLKSCQVIAAYPHGSPDIESSVSRIPKYTAEMRKMGVEIVDDIPTLLTKVDAVLLETNDGRPHLEQVAPVLKAGKPCFIDKPIAGSLADCLAIFKLSEHYKTPLFSSSSLRFGKNTQAARNGSLGDINGCATWSPCSLEKTHPDLFWYGIHGVESLFTVMGPGVETVTRTQTDDFELVTGIWNDGRIGTFRGIRLNKLGYGGIAFGSETIGPVGSSDGYAPLVLEIARFFHTREVPIDPAETVDIYAFMEAADASKRNGFIPIRIEDVMKEARAAAEAQVEAIINRDSE